MLSECSREEIAWAAGLFEGEGTFFAKRRDDRRGSCTVARLAMCDRDVVERWAALVGCGSIRTKRHRPGHRPIHDWYVQNAADVADLARTLLPWLGERRSARARDVIAICDEIMPHSRNRTHCPQGHEYTPENTLVENRRSGPRRRCRRCREGQVLARWLAR